MYVKQLTIPLALEKGGTILANVTTQITLQSQYTPTSYQIQLIFEPTPLSL